MSEFHFQQLKKMHFETEMSFLMGSNIDTNICVNLQFLSLATGRHTFIYDKSSTQIAILSNASLTNAAL